METIVYKIWTPEPENEAQLRGLGRLHGLEPREEVDVAAVEVVSADACKPAPLKLKPRLVDARKAPIGATSKCRQLTTM